MPEQAKAEPRGHGLRAIPRGIWALGFVSMFMDTASELIHSLLPVFMVSVLGASVLSVGLIEGLAEAMASITKVFSGPLSDYLRQRKMLTVIGYSLAACTKPLFPLATSVDLVFTARFVDRIGKGIRSAPRDALIGDIAPPALRGACYGLRQSLDTIGAVAGPLLAMALMARFANNIRAVFWAAVIPACIAVVLLVTGVKEPEKAPPEGKTRSPIRLADLRRLTGAFWGLLLIACVLTLARFSEAFLVLRAANVGLPVALVPFVLVIMSLVYALAAYPAGCLSDGLGRRVVLMAGVVVLMVAHVVLALTQGVGPALTGVVLWGLHMGLTQGLLAAMMADTTPPLLRGTAFGVFNLGGGVAMLGASVLAGWLWDHYGPPATFFAGAGFTAVALVSLMGLCRSAGTATGR